MQMTFVITKKTRVLVQGITGHHGSYHTQLMKEYGTNIVCGVTPGKGGQQIAGVPVYNSVKEARKKHDVAWSIMFVPASEAKQAALDAIEQGLHLVIITEGIPVHDTLAILEAARRKKCTVIGPNCPGIVIPTETKLGIMPGQIFLQGNVGIVSRSGTLTYEIVHQLSTNGIGQSIVIGIGGDMTVGSSFSDVLAMFEKDRRTKQIVLIGEIGGTFEEEAATFIKKSISKPVVAYIAGRTAPEGKQMGHAGAIIMNKKGTYAAKVKALENAGVHVAETPAGIPLLITKIRRSKLSST